MKKTAKSPVKPRATMDLHLRVPADLESAIRQLAQESHLTPSALAIIAFTRLLKSGV